MFRNRSNLNCNNKFKKKILYCPSGVKLSAEKNTCHRVPDRSSIIDSSVNFVFLFFLSVCIPILYIIIYQPPWETLFRNYFPKIDLKTEKTRGEQEST